jgi:Glycosyl hydrolases family 2, TIM barrel domain
MKAGKIVRVPLYVAIGLIIVLVGSLYGRSYIFQPFSSLLKTITSTDSVASSGFVTRSGSQLLLDGSPFRFAGSNMHWLALDDFAEYPSQFRVNDGLDAAKEMGATVIRVHSLGISTGCNNCLEPSLGVFNNIAFQHDDYVIKAAEDHNLRLIIPLTDNWHYATGGKHTFTDWRGISDEKQFYSNPLVIKDFETYIATLLNHVNTYTGVAYKNDPTILAWETGNELDATTAWTKLISTYIKHIDSNHLVIDGRTGVDPLAATLTNVDIVSNHYYPMKISTLIQNVHDAQKAGKAFLIGEFDWNNANGGDPLSSFLTTIESNPSISGDLFWELWSHNDQYGYVSSDISHMVHYPGDSAAMRKSVQQLRTHAYKMRHMPVPVESIPGAPLLNVVIRRDIHDNMLVWKGVTLAANYTIERSTSSENGPWTTICDKCATDMNTPWIDTTAPTGFLWYRVTAYNLAGVAGKPSAPYQASSASIIVDSLNDWSKTYQHSSSLTFDTANSQYMDGDSSRVERTTATQQIIIWRQDGMRSFQAITYFWPGESVSHFSFYTSLDGRNWTLFHPAISNVYDDWPEYIYTLNGLNVNYVKLMWNNIGGQIWNPQLSEVTITY